MQQHVCRSTTGFVCTHTYKRTEYRCHIVDVMDDVTHRLYIAFTLRAIYLHIGHESLKYSTTFVKCGLLHYQVWLIGSVYRTNIAQMARLITAPTKQNFVFRLINLCLVCWSRTLFGPTILLELSQQSSIAVKFDFRHFHTLSLGGCSSLRNLSFYGPTNTLSEATIALAYT